MKNQLRGCVKINAKGRNIYKFINEIHNSNFNCFGQYCKGDLFICEIYRSDLRKFRRLAGQYEIELKTFEYDTLSSKIIRYRKRIGIFIGFIILVSGLVYFSSTLMTIEIQGNNKVSDEAVLHALEELGIKTGTPIRDIDYIYAENKLMVMVNGVSWAGMHRTGNRLVVEVTEPVEKPQMLNERMPCNVVAGKNAQIVSVSVYDGMLMRIVGDYVMSGELLISGVTGDDTGHTTIHHAMGKIIGIYEEEASFSEKITAVRTVPTGRTHTQKRLEMFNIDIPLFIGKGNYENSITQSEERKLTLFGKVLPVKIITDTIEETETEEITLNEQELHKQLMEKIYLYEKNFLSSDAEILDREITKQNDGETLTYNVKYDIKGDICVQKDIFIK